MRWIGSSVSRCYFVTVYSYHTITLHTIFTLIYLYLYCPTSLHQHGIYSQPGVKSVFTEESKSTPWVRCCMCIQKGSQPLFEIKYWNFQPSLWVLSWRWLMSVQWVWWSRMMTIPIARSGMVKVKTQEYSQCLSISKRMIWTSNKRCYIKTRWADIRHYKLHAIHSERHGSMPILLMCALHIWICEIQRRT